MSNLDLDRAEIEQAVDQLDLDQMIEADEIRKQELGQDEIREIRETGDLDQDELLDTSGVLSYVQEEDELLGHIQMIEWDGVTDAMRMISDIARKPGISILLRSSPGNWHGYNLTVRPFEQQVLRSLRATGDPGQVRWTARRGYATLRILPKIRSESREIYKPAPTVEKVFVDPTDEPQSRRHAEILIDMCRRSGSDDLAEQIEAGMDQHEIVGDRLTVDHYQTVSDESKHLLAGGW